MSANSRRAYYMAVRDCITWLHQRAGSMNDPKASNILNSAAFALGVDKPSPDLQELAANNPERLG